MPSSDWLRKTTWESVVMVLTKLERLQNTELPPSWQRYLQILQCLNLLICSIVGHHSVIIGHIASLFGPLVSMLTTKRPCFRETKPIQLETCINPFYASGPQSDIPTYWTNKMNILKSASSWYPCTSAHSERCKCQYRYRVHSGMAVFRPLLLKFSPIMACSIVLSKLKLAIQKARINRCMGIAAK